MVRKTERRGGGTNSWVLILSVGVTAKRDSVNPAPNPAMTVLGPEIFPFSSWRAALIASKATNPIKKTLYQLWPDQYQQNPTPVSNSRIPALREFPMINVVHPAYHCFPNGGHGSFWPSARRRLSWVRVFATRDGWVLVGEERRIREIFRGNRSHTLGRVSDSWKEYRY